MHPATASAPAKSPARAGVQGGPGGGSASGNPSTPVRTEGTPARRLSVSGVKRPLEPDTGAGGNAAPFGTLPKANAALPLVGSQDVRLRRQGEGSFTIALFRRSQLLSLKLSMLLCST